MAQLLPEFSPLRNSQSYTSVLLHNDDRLVTLNLVIVVLLLLLKERRVNMLLMLRLLSCLEVMKRHVQSVIPPFDDQVTALRR